jgi:hypothetical protein
MGKGGERGGEGNGVGGLFLKTGCKHMQHFFCARKPPSPGKIRTRVGQEQREAGN